MSRKTKRRISFGLENVLDAFYSSSLYSKLLASSEKSHFGFYNNVVLFKLVQKILKYRLEDYVLYAIPQSHLDAAWLWCVRDTKIRALKTFYMAINHIEKYPFFKISITSPQYYSWIKKYNPDLWQKVKYYVDKGKIDPVGGSWIEPDLNCSDGESLVRQRLYGQLFYLRNFRKISKVEDLLDTFGFPNTFPQILVKSGAETFWTTKITWNDYTLFPFANFYWRSPDGSEIFTHHFKFNVMALLDLGLYKTTARLIKNNPDSNDLVFNSSRIKDCRYLAPFQVMGNRVWGASKKPLAELDNFLSDDYIKTLGLFYGLGDGGKGPLEYEIHLMAALDRYYNQKHVTMHQYFRFLKKELKEKMKGRIIWDDELYLEYHRGCLTSHSDVKKMNRKLEQLLISSEMLLTLLTLNGIDMTPQNWSIILNIQKLIWRNWRKLLFNQFHDILPGSGIPEVYVLTHREYREIELFANTLIKLLIAKLAEKINQGTGSTASSNYLVFNPVLTKNHLFDYQKSLLIEDMASFSIKEVHFANNNDNNNHHHFLSKENKDLGEESQENPLINVTQDSDAIFIENSKIKLLFSKKDGRLKGLWLKINQEDGHNSSGTKKLILSKNLLEDVEEHDSLLNKRGAGLEAFKEKIYNNPYPAWNLFHYYYKFPFRFKLVEPPEITFRPLYSAKSDSGERISKFLEVKSVYKFKNSSASVIYRILPDSEIVHITTDIELKKPKTLVKYRLPINFNIEHQIIENGNGNNVATVNTKNNNKADVPISSFVLCDMPYGSILRKRVPKTEMERAKWEFMAQKYINVSDGKIGLALYNNSKYGFSADSKALYITLLRSPPYPAPGYYKHEKKFSIKNKKPLFSDLKHHTIDFAIRPYLIQNNNINQGPSYLDKLINSDIISESLAYNNPPFTFNIEDLGILNAQLSGNRFISKKEELLGKIIDANKDNHDIGKIKDNYIGENSQKELEELIGLLRKLDINADINKIKVNVEHNNVLVRTIKYSEWLLFNNSFIDFLKEKLRIEETTGESQSPKNTPKENQKLRDYDPLIIPYDKDNSYLLLDFSDYNEVETIYSLIDEFYSGSNHNKNTHQILILRAFETMGYGKSRDSDPLSKYKRFETNITITGLNPDFEIIDVLETNLLENDWRSSLDHKIDENNDKEDAVNNKFNDNISLEDPLKERRLKYSVELENDSSQISQKSTKTIKITTEFGPFEIKTLKIIIKKII
ncbi:MAG: glycoside hydrolase family 38 C-terminal domain-containing protein [Promethearchaeota archaeon]